MVCAIPLIIGHSIGLQECSGIIALQCRTKESSKLIYAIKHSVLWPFCLPMLSLVHSSCISREFATVLVSEYAVAVFASTLMLEYVNELGEI